METAPSLLRGTVQKRGCKAERELVSVADACPVQPTLHETRIARRKLRFGMDLGRCGSLDALATELKEIPKG